MSKWWTVARQEYGTNVRRKGFLASVLGVPLLFIGGFGALFAFIVFGSDPKGIGYIDQSGLLAAQPERVVITDTLLPDVPVLRFSDEAAAQAATRAETIDGYMVVPSDYLTSGVLLGYAVDSLPDVSQDAFETFFRRSLVARGVSAAPERLSNVVTETRQRTLVTGREATGGQALLLFFAPYLFGMFFFIAIFSSGSYLMTAVVEEKENRVM
ncbi:MAG TPA: ABC transporter permease, partial [Herpetosiphonaceae bacterium]